MFGIRVIRKEPTAPCLTALPYRKHLTVLPRFALMFVGEDNKFLKRKKKPLMEPRCVRSSKRLGKRKCLQDNSFPFFQLLTKSKLKKKV